MNRTTRQASALVLALSLATPAMAQTGGATGGGTPGAVQGATPGAPLRTEGGPTAAQGGPQGSEPAPIAPQLQAVQQSLLNADQQLSRARSSNQPPNFDQALRAVMAGQDTLAELRSTGRGDTGLVRAAERELAETRRLLETPNPDLTRVSTQIRQTANAITTLGSATGATTGGTPAPGQPAMGGGTTR